MRGPPDLIRGTKQSRSRRAPDDLWIVSLRKARESGLRLDRVNCDNRRLCHSETTGFGIGQLMVNERRISRALNL